MSPGVTDPSTRGAVELPSAQRRWDFGPWAEDAAIRNRFWRRTIHVAGALVLLYFVIPGNFGYLPWPNATEVTLLVLLGGVLVFELLRQLGRVKVPLIREYEEGRVAAFAWYAVALTVAVLLFPEPIAVGVVLGVALVDPLIGELRARPDPRAYPYLPFAVYFVLVVVPLLTLGAWRLPLALSAAALAAVLALLAERPRVRYLDDDFLMTVVPAVFLLLVATYWPGGVTG